MDIKIFWVDHGPMKVMGIRVNDFAYLTDVNGIPDDVRPLLEGLDHLILDAVRHKPHPNHFCLSEALVEAEKIAAETTWLTHLSDDYDHDVDEPDLPPCVRFAYDGLKLTI